MVRMNAILAGGKFRQGQCAFQLNGRWRQGEIKDVIDHGDERTEILFNWAAERDDAGGWTIAPTESYAFDEGRMLIEYTSVENVLKANGLRFYPSGHEMIIRRPD